MLVKPGRVVEKNCSPHWGYYKAVNIIAKKPRPITSMLFLLPPITLLMNIVTPTTCRLGSQCVVPLPRIIAFNGTGINITFFASTRGYFFDHFFLLLLVYFIIC